MSAVRRAVFTIFCLSVCAQAQTRTLAVYSGSAQHLESSTMHALQVELQRVLTPAGIDMTWVQSGLSENQPEVQLAMVGTFDGDCSVANLPDQPGHAIRTRTLADSSTSDGHVLPYFRVDCANIIRTLSPILRPLNVPMRERILGRAVARTIAHEMYHFLAQTTGHETSGIAKASLSLSDLSATEFDFSPESLGRMQAPPSPQPSRTVLAVLTRR